MIPSPGSASTHSYRDLGSDRSSPTYSSITSRTSPSIRGGRRGFGKPGRRCSSSGANTISFALAEAQAYKRDVPDAEIHILDAGHFALEEKVDEIAALMHAFLDRR
jgi:hypothetical protein